MTILIEYSEQLQKVVPGRQRRRVESSTRSYARDLWRALGLPGKPALQFDWSAAGLDPWTRCRASNDGRPFSSPLLLRPHEESPGDTLVFDSQMLLFWNRERLLDDGRAERWLAGTTLDVRPEDLRYLLRNGTSLDRLMQAEALGDTEPEYLLDRVHGEAARVELQSSPSSPWVSLLEVSLATLRGRFDSAFGFRPDVDVGADRELSTLDYRLAVNDCPMPKTAFPEGQALQDVLAGELFERLRYIAPLLLANPVVTRELDELAEVQPFTVAGAREQFADDEIGDIWRRLIASDMPVVDVPTLLDDIVSAESFVSHPDQYSLPMGGRAVAIHFDDDDETGLFDHLLILRRGTIADRVANESGDVPVYLLSRQVEEGDESSPLVDSLAALKFANSGAGSTIREAIAIGQACQRFHDTHGFDRKWRYDSGQAPVLLVQSDALSRAQSLFAEPLPFLNILTYPVLNTGISIEPIARLGDP